MKYYLIARNRKDNTFTVLKLQETWYLGQEKGRSDIVTRANDLEAIDLVTTRFCSEQEMADRMAINGYILDSDVDIFIASKRQKDGNNYIKFEEVIYNPKGQKITDALRRVAQTSLVSDFKDDSFDLDIIYNDVISTAYMANDYLEMLLEGDTNVPCDFCEQLREIQKYEDIPLELKLNANFGASDYATVRNIVESLNRLNRLGRSYKVDRIDSNSNFVASNLSKRLELVPELAIEIDKDYVEGQMSLFSLLEPSANNKKKKTQ